MLHYYLISMSGPNWAVLTLSGQFFCQNCSKKRSQDYSWGLFDQTALELKDVALELNKTAFFFNIYALKLKDSIPKLNKTAL